MDKKHFNFGSSIRDWYTQAFPDDELGYIIDPDATFAGAVKFMAYGGEVYEYLGVVDSLVRENVFSKIAAITGVEYEDVYDLWLHHDASECGRLVFLGDHPDCAVDPDWRDGFEDAIGMDGNGLTAGLVTDDLDSIKSLVARCPAWIECLPSYSAKAAKGVDDVVQAVKTYRANAKRAFRESIPGRIPECLFEGARAAASKTAGGADIGTGPHI